MSLKNNISARGVLIVITLALVSVAVAQNDKRVFVLEPASDLEHARRVDGVAAGKEGEEEQGAEEM